jgi:lysozyme family protein
MTQAIPFRSSIAMPDNVDPFTAAVNEVLGEEAGYVNNPADPGGETKWGISKRAFPDVDIANLSRDDAAALYRTHYWDPLEEFHLSGKFQLVAFEAAVNQGLSRVKPWLVAAEGQLDWFMAERALAYFSDKNFSTFGKGWLRRLFKEVV